MTPDQTQDSLLRTGQPGAPANPGDHSGQRCVRCITAPGDRVVIGTGWVCAGCATSDEREL